MPRGVGLDWVYDEARLQGRLWTPELSGTDFWWSGQDGQTNMATWPARRGNVTLTQTGTGASTLTQYGSVRARLINGVNGYLSGTVDVSGLSGMTIFILGSMNDRGGTNNNGMLSYAQGSSTFNNDILWGNDGGNTGLLQFNNGADGSNFENNVRSYSGALFGRFDGVARTIQMIVNGVQRGVIGPAGFTPPTTLSTGMTTLVLGRYSTILSSNVWAGNATIAHLMIWRRALTTAEMNRVNAWAAWEAGLQGTVLLPSNPYANRPPLIGD